MLTNDILKALAGYAKYAKTSNLCVAGGEHPKRPELVKFLSDIASVSDQIHFEERDMETPSAVPSASCSRSMAKVQAFSFQGIPAGHEFNSLVLAMLQATGTQLS